MAALQTLPASTAAGAQPLAGRSPTKGGLSNHAATRRLQRRPAGDVALPEGGAQAHQQQRWDQAASGAVERAAAIRYTTVQIGTRCHEDLDRRSCCM